MSDLNQVVVPKTVFIGDKAELHISLLSFGNNISSFQAGPLPIDAFLGKTDENLYSINSVHFVKTSNGADLVISFTPWVTGEIKLPTYRLSDQILVSSDPVKIESILENQGVSTLQPAIPVKFTPGTMTKIWLYLVILIVLVLAIVRLVIKRKDVVFFIKNQKLKRFYKKNRKSAEKQIRDVIRNTNKDLQRAGEKAAALQKIMRIYLENRFGWPFTKAETSRIMYGFDQVFQGLLSEEKSNAVEDLIGIFIRTDYLRYGPQETASSEKALSDEFLETETRLMSIINILESESGGDNA